MQTSFTYSIHGMIWLMDAIANQQLKTKYDITFRKFYVLAVLSSCQPSTQANLASYLGQSTAAVSKSLTVLEKDCLVSVTADPEHKRKNIIQLTEKGMALTTQASQELELLLHQHLGETTVNMKQYTTDTQIIMNKLEEIAPIYLS